MPRKCARVADAPAPLPLGELSRGAVRNTRACGARLYTQLTAPRKYDRSGTKVV